jgi:hypothetical protein
MKNKIILGLVAVALIAIVVFTFSVITGTVQNSTEIKSSAEDHTHSIAPAERISLKKTRYINKKQKTVSTFPQECSQALNDLSAQTMEEIMVRLKSKVDFDLFFPIECQQQLQTNKLFLDLAQNSQCQFLQADFVPNEMCSSLLFALKAFTIADATQDVELSHMSSTELAAHFVKMFFSLDKLTPENFSKNLELIHTLLERHSDDPSVLEAYIGYTMIGEQISGSDIALEKSRQILTSNMGKHFKVDRLSVLQYVASKDYEGAKTALDRLSQTYAQEPELKYYYAAYYWKQGDRAMANQYLDQAIAMGDKCSYCVPGMYKMTKQQMKKAKLGDEKLFSISIGLNFENL